ncbi:MAG: transcription-repair coupling factor [Gammaproteobacteria bacterium]|nr:transcription-repair coupling factor [Gammaproteobacteria bacterium]
MTSFFDITSTLPWPNAVGKRTAVGPLSGAAESEAIGELAKTTPLILVITDTTAAAHNLASELPFFLSEEREILLVPDWETLPYDNFSPHEDIVSDRLKALSRLPTLVSGVVIVSITTLMHRLAPRHFIDAGVLSLSTGDTLDAEQFVRNLTRNGYRSVDTVYEHGEFAIRGSLLDVFPMGSDEPLRIDLFDGEIESLRSFDPETQRTAQRLARIDLLPAREFPLHTDAIERFKIDWYRSFDGDPERCSVFNEVSQGRAPQGAEYYLPLFFDECHSMFDYLPDNTPVVMVGNNFSSANRFWDEVNRRFEEYGVDPRRPLVNPRRGFIPVEELYAAIGNHCVLEFRDSNDVPLHFALDTYTPEPFASEDEFRNVSGIGKLSLLLKAHESPVLLSVESAGRREIILESLAKEGLQAQAVESWEKFQSSGVALGITVTDITRPLFTSPTEPVLVSEDQLFGQRVAQKRRRKIAEETDAQAIIRDLTELRAGLPVVHLEHGVGRYMGLEKLTIEGHDAEFLLLEYANKDKLYVPVGSLHLISRYAGGDQDTAPLHRLGTEQWTKARKRASERASDVAAQLLEVYAKREARTGFAHSLDEQSWQLFCSSFTFEETPDQTSAIDAVRQDMCAEKVMDRLVCGDVGFGKTEVAMRAAFIAAQNQKQVAVLVPTTLLAQQHYNNFNDRFVDWPITIEVVSRFKTAKDIAAVSRRLQAGEIDILVGTHKLLQTDFGFKDLGLLIIDEEHRFGVKQKEAIKALRAEVDILTMTATPIPRTLNMALGGLRDLSIIATPPAKRLSIKTFIREHNIGLVKEAILRETLRGGQVYYLHNEVKTLEETARKLSELVPDLSFGVAHGQLREQELEGVMTDFYHQRHNVLVCSTIIETGIDVPNANTIIINRADKFGLAQLHQLRGRVGRSHHQAYAYLLTPPRSALTSDAEKRLEAIESAGALGAGFMLASHDLEIRGAGELLGDEQSGQIEQVGFSLYLEMLNRAVESLRKGEIPDVDAPLETGTEIKMHLPALIPDDYLPNISTRLVLYKRIAQAQDLEALNDIQVEMIDRFGLLPEATKQLFIQAEIRLRAQALGISEVDVGDAGGSVKFESTTPVPVNSLLALLQSNPKEFKLAGSDTLRFIRELESGEARRHYIEKLMTEWEQACTGS